MSTDHPILTRKDKGEELTLLESSSEFTLYHENTKDSSDDGLNAITRDMSLEELKAMNQRLSQIISYYDPDFTGTKV